ncbi:MAG: hypothetical protein IJM98_08965 [Oscillospiraceae bacterium]|nr:hypothetical protein [Oscillospiraceae bacterium]
MQVKLTERERKILECFRKDPEGAMECLKKVLSERKEKQNRKEKERE